MKGILLLAPLATWEFCIDENAATDGCRSTLSCFAGYLIELAQLQSSLWPNHFLFKSKVSYGKLVEKVRYCVREVI